MIHLVIATSVLMVAGSFVFFGIYDLFKQLKKQKYDRHGNYIPSGDEPYEGTQVTSVPEKQIEDIIK
jgi:hypothetical protein